MVDIENYFKKWWKTKKEVHYPLTPEKKGKKEVEGAALPKAKFPTVIILITELWNLLPNPIMLSLFSHVSIATQL